jgi:hypothetical protein
MFQINFFLFNNKQCLDSFLEQFRTLLDPIGVSFSDDSDPQRFRKRGAGTLITGIDSFLMSRETRAAAWRWTEA